MLFRMDEFDIIRFAKIKYKLIRENCISLLKHIR